jgi:hypothetical protein
MLLRQDVMLQRPRMRVILYDSTQKIQHYFFFPFWGLSGAGSTYNTKYMYVRVSTTLEEFVSAVQSPQERSKKKKEIPCPKQQKRRGIPLCSFYPVTQCMFSHKVWEVRTIGLGPSGRHFSCFRAYLTWRLVDGRGVLISDLEAGSQHYA